MPFPARDPHELFLSRIIHEGEHWHFDVKLGRDPEKRPAFSVDGISMPAARAGYLLFRGPLNGLDASHLCGDRLCVNPWHLIGESNKDNNARERRTHCKNGHELTAENRRSGGFTKAGTERWKCRLCDNARDKIRNRRRRAAQ
jgi:hypothetical protein